MSESNTGMKRGPQDLSRSFAEAVLRSPKKSKDGSMTDETSNPLPITSSTPIFHGNGGLDPNSPAYYPGIQPQYVVAPMGISPEDIKKIAEAVRDAIKDSLREEFSKIVDEKVTPLKAQIHKLQTDNDDLRRQLDDLEQYGRRPLIRFSGIQETPGEDTRAKILEATSKAGINLQSDDIVNSHRVGNPSSSRRKGPRQIIARLKSVDTKFHILRNARKFQQHSQTKHISANEDLTKLRDRLLFLCRQLCRQRQLKNARTSNGKITVKDQQDNYHVIRDERDLVKFGHTVQNV